MSDRSNVEFSEREALFFHATGRPGKIEIIASKPMATQRDLSLAYSPGVAVPVQAIADDPANAAKYTARSNLVAVITNGTAILGMGNLGALAAKPVMEGKSVLFKRFADVDSIDLELDTEDPDKFIEAVALMEPTFGGINLEDIAAPECFIIEQALRERMNIPIMHDDQHGTAIIAAAGLINACHLTGRKFKDCRMVVNGAGASALACTALIKAIGIPSDQVIVCDRSGPIHKGRDDLDQWKSAHAVETDARSLEEALEGADIFLGLSAAGALKPEWVKKMADQPIIFAMANPVPEIMPEDAKAVRPDAIIATGRSDYPNQVNNVLGFPFIFRGALDVRATAINEEMKIAAAEAIAALARERVPEEVAAAYGKSHKFGTDYIIPAPFDPRLMEVVSSAVAEAAMKSGVAQAHIEDLEAYRLALKSRLNPTTSVLTQVYEEAKANPKRVVFAEAEEDVALRAAIQFRDFGYGTPVLVGRTKAVADKMHMLGVSDPGSFEIQNSADSEHVPEMVEFLYKRLQRRGYTERDVARMVNQERNVFAALLVALGRAYAKRDLVMQLHVNALRSNRTRLRESLGPDVGADSPRDISLAEPLNTLLDRLDRDGTLPRSVLYGLDTTRNAAIVTTAGNFQDGSIPGKIQAGTAWWFNDQLDGMEDQMRTLAQMGLISTFLGMLTDSRSFLSFPRHEYFRRLFCRIVGRWQVEGHVPDDQDAMDELVRDVCYRNARDWFL